MLQAIGPGILSFIWTYYITQTVMDKPTIEMKTECLRS